ncbi:hypothetical protein VNO77_42611 [Canavalia gladiata]|uniref:MADS-box domain-containing protein n=1 Tax=Canavalia gladiata TaxID=3824 RepID=A0AAN9JUU7_CANGL
MGRQRITLKRISNDRTRKNTFKHRANGLVKKIHEFCTMCGAEACFIAYDDGNGNVGPMTWPQDPTLVHSIIEKYERQKNDKPPKTFNLEDFFENRKNTVEAEISRVQKEITKIKYPTWDRSFSELGEEQLRAFIAMLDTKIEACDHRVNMLKNLYQSEANFNLMHNNLVQEGANSSHPSQLNFIQNMISQSQLIPSPMEPLIDNKEMVNFTNSTNHVGGACNNRINMLPNFQQGDARFGFIPNMVLESASSSNPRQFNCTHSMPQNELILATLKPFNNNNRMVDVTNQVNNVPLDSTNYQLGEPKNLANQVGDEFEHWLNESIEIPQDWFNQVGGGDLGGGVSKLDEPMLQNIIPFQSHK